MTCQTARYRRSGAPRTTSGTSTPCCPGRPGAPRRRCGRSRAPWPRCARPRPAVSSPTRRWPGPRSARSRPLRADHGAGAMDGGGGACGRYLPYSCSSPGRPPAAARSAAPAPAPGGQGARKPRIAVTGAAAAALVAVAVVAGALTGSIGELTSFGRQPASASASARATGQSPGSQGTLVTGAASEPPQNPKPTVSATPATPRPTSGPGSLCREYFEYFDYSEHLGQGDEAALTSPARAAEQAGGRSESVQDLRVLPSLPRQPARRQGRLASARSPGRRPRADAGRQTPGTRAPAPGARETSRAGRAIKVRAPIPGPALARPDRHRRGARPGQASSASASRMTEQACSKAAS